VFFHAESLIDGLDDRWVPLDKNGERSLSGLRDGRYNLRARVVGAAGDFSPEASINFKVDPPFWRSPQSISFSSLCVLSLAFAGHRWRTKALRGRNLKLEGLIQKAHRTACTGKQCQE